MERRQQIASHKLCLLAALCAGSCRGWDGHTALSSPGGIPKSQGRMALIHLSHSKLFFSGSIPNQSPVNPQLAGCTNGSGTGEYFLGLILSLPQIGPQVSLVCAWGCARSELKPAELSSCALKLVGALPWAGRSLLSMILFQRGQERDGEAERRNFQQRRWHRQVP